jgi:hypothetical protein
MAGEATYYGIMANRATVAGLGIDCATYLC